jgi:hypothetical protein
METTINDMLKALRGRLEAVLESENIDGVELDQANVSLGYLNCAIAYNVLIESEDYVSIYEQVIDLEAM